MSTNHQIAEANAHLNSLPPQDAKIVTSVRSPEDLRQRVLGNVRKEAHAAIDAQIEPPVELEDSRIRSAWTPAVKAAGLQHAEDGSQPSLPARLPMLRVVETERVARAQLRIPESRANQSLSTEELDKFREARRLDGSRTESPEPLRQQLNRLRLYEVGLLGVEGVIMANNAAVATGLYEQPSGSVSLGTFGPAIGLAVGGVLVTGVVGHLLGGVIHRAEANDGDTRRSKTVLRFGLILLAVVIMLVVFGNAAIRVGAATPDAQTSASATNAGTMVLSILAIGAVIAALAAIVASYLRTKGEFDAVKRAYDHETGTEGELSQAADLASRKLQDIEREASRLQHLEAAFEADCLTASAVYSEFVRNAGTRLAAAVSAFEFLQTLPASIRSAVVRQAASRGASGGRGPMGMAFGVALALASVVSTTGCAEKAKPLSVAVLCDASAPNPSSRCDRRFVDRVLDAWVALSLPADSRFSVVVSSNSLSTTTRTDIAVVPERFVGEARGAKARWIKDARERVLSLSLPEVHAEGGDNESNLTAALLVVERFAQGLPGHRVVVVAATDGLIINGTANFERVVPTPDAFFKSLKKAGGVPELTVDQVVVCGLRHEGFNTAVAAERRDHIVTRLLSVGGRAPDQFPEGCDAMTEESLRRIIGTATASAKGT